jgi:hypothetical protein
MTHDQGEPPLRWTEEQLKRRRQRNLALALVLGALVVLFFVVTVAKLGGNVAERPTYGSIPALETAVIGHIG